MPAWSYNYSGFFFYLIIFFIEATKKKTEGRGASSKLISRSIRRSEYIKGVCVRVCVCVYFIIIIPSWLTDFLFP